nr:MAG TPA: hypothetical protein [Bacteriophage sp.]
MLFLLESLYFYFGFLRHNFTPYNKKKHAHNVL